MIVSGIDCGAKNTKTMIMNNGEVIGKGSVLTGFDQQEAVHSSLDIALKSAGLAQSDIEKFAGTGSGMKSVDVADCMVNDIKAMAKAANYFYPKCRTVTDVGAEEGRAVKIDEILQLTRNALLARALL
jgi:benzoyl-CoA reductase subunit D